LFLLLILVPFEFFSTSTTTVLLALGLPLGGHVLFAAINWRCPGCRRFLGFGYGVRFCPGCRLQFK
jgi:hypothetical protein